ncbi:unnamed protein product [Rotaria sordida]|uniref:Geranylgeranyl transferase type II subunit beta n=1 Tax=Rotaria sordida TaxID=392033 RepID=A0A814XEX4_9BILA|nr:unnamed protein product [Rotaria sordida]CAF1486709.1 unnamed protein product [Rotaria sordida]
MGIPQAVQLLVQLNRIDLIDKKSLCSYIKQLQHDESFIGDQWKEIDTCFSFCTVACLKLIDSLDIIDIDRATNFIMICLNFDGDFGCIPGAKSHAGQIYCCLGFLSLVQRLDNLDLSTGNIEKLSKFILAAQDDETDGCADRPGNISDPFHTLFWVVGLLLLNTYDENIIRKVNSVLCMPEYIVQRT